MTHEPNSLLVSFRSLPQTQQIEILSTMSQEQIFSLLYDWELQARPEQLEPEVPWTIWMLLTGRGFGKTLTGAQTTRKKVEKQGAQHIALVGPTAADTRDVMLGLIPDSSGLMQVCPPWNRPEYHPSYRSAIWPNGATATLYSGEEPERLRGPQHDFAWGDEPASWIKGEDVLSNLLFGLRRGLAQLILTGTPKPVPIIKQLLKDPTVIVTRWSMYDNPFLTATAIARIKRQYEGTRLGRQEIYGDVLEDNPDALWTHEMIDVDRMTFEDYSKQVADGRIVIKRTTVAIDPAVTSTKDSNKTGINVACIDSQNPPHAYILKDATMVARPEGWAMRAVGLYKDHMADRVVGEVNNGGDLIESTLRAVDPNVSYKDVRATKGKLLRAEPCSALYEKHRVHHIGNFPEMEDEMCEYDGSQESPDRLDALVWNLTELIVVGEENEAEAAITYLLQRVATCTSPLCKGGITTYVPPGQDWVACRGCGALTQNDARKDRTSGATNASARSAEEMVESIP